MSDRFRRKPQTFWTDPDTMSTVALWVEGKLTTEEAGDQLGLRDGRKSSPEAVLKYYALKYGYRPPRPSRMKVEQQAEAAEAVADILWTFNPVYPEIYPAKSPKVIVVGAEPNDKQGAWPDRDMGSWLRAASAANNYLGNRIFYEATLQQVRAVLPNVPDHAADVILQHVRYVDLKGTGGGGRTTTGKVAAWLRAHVNQVVAYWLNDRPAYTILQGIHAQTVFETIVVPQLRANNVEGLKVGLPHPSGQNRLALSDPAYLTALTHVHKKLRRLDEPLVRWAPASKQWYPPVPPSTPSL